MRSMSLTESAVLLSPLMPQISGQPSPRLPCCDACCSSWPGLLESTWLETISSHMVRSFARCGCNTAASADSSSARHRSLCMMDPFCIDFRKLRMIRTFCSKRVSVRHSYLGHNLNQLGRIGSSPSPDDCSRVCLWPLLLCLHFRGRNSIHVQFCKCWYGCSIAASAY